MPNCIRKSEGKRPLDRLRRRWITLLKFILKKEGMRYRWDAAGSGNVPIADCCGYHNQPFVFHTRRRGYLPPSRGTSNEPYSMGLFISIHLFMCLATATKANFSEAQKQRYKRNL
jgi:hypothetical protein